MVTNKQAKQTQGNSQAIARQWTASAWQLDGGFLERGGRGKGGVPYFSILIIFTLYIYSPYFITYSFLKTYFVTSQNAF